MPSCDNYFLLNVTKLNSFVWNQFNKYNVALHVMTFYLYMSEEIRHVNGCLYRTFLVGSGSWQKMNKQRKGQVYEIIVLSILIMELLFKYPISSYIMTRVQIDDFISLPGSEINLTAIITWLKVFLSYFIWEDYSYPLLIVYYKFTSFFREGLYYSLQKSKLIKYFASWKSWMVTVLHDQATILFSNVLCCTCPCPFLS